MLSGMPDAAANSLERLGQGAGSLYLQVKRALLSRIEARAWSAGDQLPSETLIAGQLGVSIGTLRRAVDELVQEQVLVRRQGKGTFVALHSRDRYLFQFFRVEPREERFGAGVPSENEYPEVECLSFGRHRAEEAAADALRLRMGDPVFVIENRLSLKRRAVVLDHIVISAALFKGLNEKRFLERSSTIYNFYQTEFGITVLHARERARAVVASRDAVRRLGVAVGTPLIEVQRLAHSFGERPVEWRTSLIHTQQHDYVSDVSAPR
jgi:GntR family transcriptional regulator